MEIIKIGILGKFLERHFFGIENRPTTFLNSQNQENNVFLVLSTFLVGSDLQVNHSRH